MCALELGRSLSSIKVEKLSLTMIKISLLKVLKLNITRFGDNGLDGFGQIFTL